MDADGSDQEGFFRKLDNLHKLRIATDRIATGAFQLGSRFIVSEQLVKGLHRTCMLGLLPDAGDYRNVNVGLTNSPYVPPNYSEVGVHMAGFCQYLNSEWNNRNMIHLAAFCMWKVNWIHPFRNGNGRISRELSYLILNVKHGMLLPPKNSIIEQIASSVAAKTAYCASLRTADNIFAATNSIDQSLAPMEDFMAALLKEQIKANL